MGKLLVYPVISFESNLNLSILFGNIGGNVVKLLLSNLNSVKDVHADTLFVNELNKRLLPKSKSVKFVFADKSMSKLRILFEPNCT